MSSETILTNALVVTREDMFSGSVTLADGLIRAVDRGPSRAPGAVDLGGDVLIPGLIEPHTDNLERQLMPRPGVLWPSALAALMAHDTQVAGAGITTVLDSICCGELNEGKMRRTIFALSVEAVRHGRRTDVLRADHLLHLRCEICDPIVMEHFEPLADDPLLRLVSLMDHTPGQRQFTSHEKYREYYGHMNWSDEQFEAMVAELRAVQERVAPAQRARVVELCRRRGVPLASHDDTTEEHVDRAGDEGVAISEFPTTEAAARRCRERGLAIVMGAPNVVRGGSHSGNVSARDMAAAGLLDILSSDYVPASLLHAAFLLHGDLGLPLPGAVALVTDNPARALGLDDRGRIAPGLRADLVRVRMVEGHPVVHQVWKRGARIL
jgi:alpha-D-ribose 1-methylphosphonate 5-triphosphate diphosphatase